MEFYLIYINYYYIVEMDSPIKEFLQQQWPNVLTIVIIFITLLSIFSILGIKFNHIKNKMIQKIVTVESFVTDNLSDSFCSDYSSDANKLDKQCNNLTENNCNSTGCCIWLNGNKCVAGGERGPMFHTTDGKDVDVEFYSWKNKCYGKDCK